MFAVGFSSFKPTLNMICFLEKFDLVGKCALFVNREKQNIEMLGPLSINRNLTKDTTQEAGNFLLAIFIPLSERTPAQMVV